MTVSINVSQLESISQILEAQPHESFYGYIDLEKDEVLLGVYREYPVQLELNPDEDENFEERYLSIPNLGSQVGFEDMEDFIKTVKDSHLQHLLESALHNQRPFTHFKSIIKGSKEIDNWYEFSSKRREKRVMDWLKKQGIKLVEG